MPEAAYDLREIARSALNDMLEDKRAAFLAEMLTELRGPQAIEHLSKVRAAVSLRMQEMIDEKFPLHEMAGVYGDAAAVRARTTAAHASPLGFFDAEGAKELVARSRREDSKRCAYGGQKVVKQPFIPSEIMAELLVARRHRRVERCKEILRIIQLVIQPGTLEGADLHFNGAAERLASLIFGEKFDDRH